MRIAVTGSLGTLGRPLVAELRDRGHEVTGIDRDHDGDPEHRRADVANFRQLSAVFDDYDFDVVYHLAAEFGRHNGDRFYEDLWTTGAIGTRNVLELCADADAHLLFASSSEIYGDVEAPILTEELSATHVLEQPNEYALSKWVNERQIVNFTNRRPDAIATRLRFFNAYGPGERFHDYRSVVALFCHKALHDEPLPVFEGYYRTFMFIDDFIPTLANAADLDRRLSHEVYNIGGEDYRSVEELAEIVIGYVGRGSIERIPEDRHNVRSKMPAIQRARDELGHDPKVKLEEGVPATVEWMLADEGLPINASNGNATVGYQYHD